jgi:DNA-binding MarR family transcriptional regulator
MLPIKEYNLIGESMSEGDILEKQKIIIAKLFLLPNKLQAVGDRIFAGEMTLRQWLLTEAVAQCCSTSPTLGEAARLLGTSHQNIKQLALNLQEAGFLRLTKDNKDLRQIHLTLTDKSYIFWRKRQEEIRLFFTELFKDLQEEEIDLLFDCINKLHESVIKIEKVSLKRGGFI